MPASAWTSSDDDAFGDDEDLVGVLESCTKELGALCGGMELQQLVEDENDDEHMTSAGADTLASLEEVAGECAALLACLEAAEHRPDNDDALSSALEKEHERPQVEEHLGNTKLAHELDSFADQLNDFLLCLGDTSADESVDENKETASRLKNNAACERDSDTVLQIIDNGDTTASGGAKEDHTDHAATSDTPTLSQTKEVFSQRTKNAIAQHVKRLALQKQRRYSKGKHFWACTQADTKKFAEGAGQERHSSVNVVWSKFQSTSFQQHIMRQKFARRRVQQTQEAQRLIELARLRGKVGSSCNHNKAPKNDNPATYLDQFKSEKTSSNELDPHYLCAVYLYGLRRFGTTFVTFSSLAQFEQRVRARFAIHDVVNIYREVTEAVIPEFNVGHHVNRRRTLKRLQRLSSLEQVNDGDTLCVTQNAYDDMTILCDWIKRRQRAMHGFQFQAAQCSAARPIITDEASTPLKPRTTTSVTQPQLWDSNGRSIGVKAQHPL
ncbi:unnamed protein product [Phytophthora lilii]|uniref:Unnamed protein product n=1 Tax=Phytophthora lilii TaxID=2077276 RepID=A0A9W6TKZ4_9STRA|nr:unnamed protein product [Phytophthora lilii]